MKVLKVILAVGLVLAFLYAQNNIIVIDKINVSSNKIPSNFDGFTIVQLSDLHGKVFGKDSSGLVSKVKSTKPDIIVITGDLINYDFYNEKDIQILVKALSKLAPVYYVTGNHEVNSVYLEKLFSALKDCGVHYLSNSSEVISRNGQSILLAGVEDPQYADMDAFSLNKDILSTDIKQAMGVNTEPIYTILLSHRPEQFPLYTEFNIDLVLSGHAHGGQIRLPFIGGLFAPNQGFLPRYTSGKYTDGNSTMIVSKGLGNSGFPQRLFNQPEIVVARLIRNPKP